jgi:hypothetical protein
MQTIRGAERDPRLSLYSGLPAPRKSELTRPASALRDCLSLDMLSAQMTVWDGMRLQLRRWFSDAEMDYLSNYFTSATLNMR